MLQLDLIAKASRSERDHTVSDHAQQTSFGLAMTPSLSKMSSVTMNSPRKGTAPLATFLFDAQRTSSKLGVIIIEPGNGITYNVQALRDSNIDQ